MKKLNSIEYSILIVLFRATNYRLQAFTLSQRVVLPFSKFLESISTLAKKNLVSTNGAVIELSQSGFYLVLAHKEKSTSLKEIPENFIREKTISINDFYVPRRSLI